MKQHKQLLGSIAGIFVSMFITSTVFAGAVPLNNRLDAWGDYGSKAVYFDNVDISYQNGKTKRGITGDTEFFATGGDNFRLDSIIDGYDMQGMNDGYLVIDANLSSKGTLRSGGTFGIYSTDSMFDAYSTDYNCNKQGKNCSTGNLVFGGDLTAFGWSGTLGILEFEIANMTGWAHDMWSPDSVSEHILLNTGAFDLNGVSSVKAFEATANGFAVVPVPAAVWLFGSGLLGLVGIARRKRA